MLNDVIKYTVQINTCPYYSLSALFQVQAFLNNTLVEPEEKIVATDIMLKEKSENEKRKKSMTKTIMWLKENMDN